MALTPAYLRALWYHWFTNKRIPDIYWFDLGGDQVALVVRSWPVYSGRVEWSR